MAVRYDDVSAGAALEPWEYRVERLDLVMYAGASGDFNPIHWSPAFAKAVGLPDTIATGMHTMARIGRYLTDWSGDPGAVLRFKNRFSGMVVVPDEGASVTVQGVVAEKLDDRRVRVTFEASSAGQIVSKGEAIIRLT
jgi:acyl dehydratase